jgi:cytochrome P450
MPLRTLLNLYRNPLTAFQSLAREYGDVAVFHIAGQPVYLLNHPDLVEAILVANSRLASKRLGTRLMRRLMGGGLITSYDEEHLQQRRMLHPVFHRRHLADFSETMVDCARQVRDRWQDGERVEIFEEMTSLTLAVVGRTLFSTDFELEAEHIHQAVIVIQNRAHIANFILGELADKLPLPMAGRTRRAVERLNASIDRAIAGHRTQMEQGDLLSLLLAAEDDHGKLNDIQVRDQAMTIFLAGFETMAVTLTWTWHLLAQHPDIEARFQAEIDRVLMGRLPTAQDLPNLKYTRQVLTEVLRLYPPVWVHGRRLAAACRVGDWELPAGSFVIINHWLLHHDPRFHTDPERFDPDRWSEDATTSLPRLAYAPFSAGPRQCIGEGYAWMEGLLVLATLAQRWHIQSLPGHSAEMLPAFTLRPRNGMQMTIKRRDG